MTLTHLLQVPGARCNKEIMKKIPVGFGHKDGVLGTRKKKGVKLMDCKDMCYQQKWCRSIQWCSNDDTKEEDDECQLYTEVPTVELPPDAPPMPQTCAFHSTSCGKNNTRLI